MSRAAYYTGVTLDGFIATSDHSLEWLVTRDLDPEGPMSFGSFDERIGACVMGANTWQWLLDHDPDGWTPRPTWVMTHREFPASEQVRFTAADVATVHAEMVEAAGGKDLWVIGGGGLAGQWAEAGLLDEVWLQYAPVTLGGAPRSCRGTSSSPWSRSPATATSSVRGTTSCGTPADRTLAR